MGCSSSKADTEEAGTAAAAGKAEPGAAAGGSGRKASEPVSPTKVEVTLDASQSTRVKELFTTWDIDASGKLELAAFTGAVTKVGPHQTKVLAQLQDMDVDHDGFVTQAEWLLWFTATAGTLNADEFNLIMEEMQTSAEEMVTLVRCTRLAAESAAEIEAPAAPPPLAGDRLEKVQALFKAWDYEGKGSIDRLKVGASSVSFGPHKSHVLKQLDDMDTDGDNLITLVEMTDFFQAISSELNDAAFIAVVGEMLELASEAATIAACLAMAVAPAVQGMEEEPEAKATLSDGRAEQLKALFDLFAKNKDGSIDVALLDQVSIKEGPNETKVLSNLKDMDADKDGKLTFDEMKAFFAAIGASLNEDEFKLIVGEMFDTVEASQLATHLAALAGS
mmetsp:Transcript_40243/g.96393  ORF Transcript_40243/g.96393 Transcript_40243/m.96393 type:complete len:391 (-) Transcript_40243:344-1516(-)